MWRNAYLQEIARYADMLPGRVLNTVFFGGGTPSLMAPDTVDAVLEAVRKAWPHANDLEVTLEANPGSVESGRFSAYAQAGVSRISMGVQALNDDALRRLGRLHSLAEARQAFDIARASFDRVSFDLMYARQDQTLDSWRAELSEALAMAVDHLSLYQLTIEPGTMFGARHARGMLRGLPDDDRAADMYQVTQDLCDSAGLPAYEVSNHAQAGAESRHNLIYWRYGDYIGIGPGAHGRITRGGARLATEAWAQPERWLAAVSDGTGECVTSAISGADQANEYLMMGMRVTDGIDRHRFERLAGAALNADTLAHLQDIGMIRISPDRIRATARGRLLLNPVITTLLEPAPNS